MCLTQQMLFYQLFCNKQMLIDTHIDGTMINRKCNTGSCMMKKGCFGGFLEFIGHNSKGVISMLSLNSIKEHYSIVHNCNSNNLIVITDQHAKKKCICKAFSFKLYRANKSNQWIFLAIVDKIS